MPTLSHIPVSLPEPGSGTLAGRVGTAAATERHYTPEELGKTWALSPDTMRRLFENEPGVLIIQKGKSSGRRYRTLRIPESVAARVHRQLSNPSCNAHRVSI
jgi:hypothetical protein